MSDIDNYQLACEIIRSWNDVIRIENSFLLNTKKKKLIRHNI